MNKTKKRVPSQEQRVSPEMEEESFRDRLIRLGIRQIDFAKMTGAGISTVQHWAQEKHRTPPLIVDILDMIEGVGAAKGVIGARDYFEWKVRNHAKQR
jgi:DNA-binding transcriptional regulator YiaG